MFSLKKNDILDVSYSPKVLNSLNIFENFNYEVVEDKMIFLCVLGEWVINLSKKIYINFF